MLAFTEFGRDIVEHVREAGFEHEVHPVCGDDTGALTVFAGRVHA